MTVDVDLMVPNRNRERDIHGIGPLDLGASRGRETRRVTAFYRAIFHRRLPSGRTSDMINIAKEPYMNERPKTNHALEREQDGDPLWRDERSIAR